MKPLNFDKTPPKLVSWNNDHAKFETQRKQLLDDYTNGKISADKYYEALARIDQNEIEYKKAQNEASYQLSQAIVHQQQVAIQQQQVAIERKKSRQIIQVTPNKKNIYNKYGQQVGYVDE